MNYLFNYSALSSYLLRSPILAFNTILTLTEKKVIELCQSPLISEAIYIASPELYNEMNKLLKGEEVRDKKKLINSLAKYIIRMSSRSIPFGLFCGCSLGNFSDHSDIKPLLPEDHKRFTRLDMNYLCALAQELERKNEIRKNLKYYKNSSIYKIGNQLRYIEYKYERTFRRHFTVSIDFSEFIDSVLTFVEKGASIGQLSNHITILEPNIKYNEILSFIDELIDNQILISSISPSVTGNDYLHIIKNNVKDKNVKKHLISISKVLQLLNQNSIGNNLCYYDDLHKILSNLEVKFDEKYILQTDLITKYENNVLNKRIIQRVNTALVFLNKLIPFYEDEDLRKFKNSFLKVYEEEEVSLSLALDVETGIGYPPNNDGAYDISPLIDDLSLGNLNYQKDKTIRWTKKDELLNNKLVNALKNNLQQIELTDKDVEGFEDHWENSPNSFSVSLEILEKSENDEELISLQYVGGATATYLMGRFCHSDLEIEKFVKNIVTKEDVQKEYMYAEICHLPEKRTGNILSRPHLRQYEIPYLSKSNLPNEQQIKIEDVLISIINDTIILRSKKNGKRIIPRLASAHNYFENSLPIYHFLCDLQYQHIKPSLTFKWGPLNSLFNYFPRILYRGIVLSSAVWIIKKNEIDQIIFNPNTLLDWKNKNKIPNKILLKEFDNELYIDLEQEFYIQLFISIIKNKNEITIKEYLFNYKNSLIKNNNLSYTNEFILAYYKKTFLNE